MSNNLKTEPWQGLKKVSMESECEQIKHFNATNSLLSPPNSVSEGAIVSSRPFIFPFRMEVVYEDGSEKL